MCNKVNVNLWRLTNRKKNERKLLEIQLQLISKTREKEKCEKKKNKMDRLTTISASFFMAADIFAIVSLATPDWIVTDVGGKISSQIK